MSVPTSCRVCGCTDFSPCVEADGFPCCWVEQDLCSACAYVSRNGRVEVQEARHFIGKEGVEQA